MVKLYALSVLHKNPTSATTLKSAYDVESFSFFQRGSVKEFMSFVSKTIVERTQNSSRQSVKEGGITINKTNFCLILIKEYYNLYQCFYRLHVSCIC